MAELSGLNYLVADLNSGKIQPEAAQDIIRKSKFFQENVKATRDALLLQKTDPATFNDTIENYKDSIVPNYQKALDTAKVEIVRLDTKVRSQAETIKTLKNVLKGGLIAIALLTIGLIL